MLAIIKKKNENDISELAKYAVLTWKNFTAMLILVMVLSVYFLISATRKYIIGNMTLLNLIDKEMIDLLIMRIW